MSILKSFTFVLLIFSSFIVSATSYTVDLNVPSQTASISNTGIETSFSDDWILTVDSGSQVLMTFAPANVNLGFFSFNINNFKVDSSGTIWTKIFTTSTTINVSGTATGAGGIYTVSSAVSAVPVPAAVWMMGTALVGMVSFGRRKVALAA